MRKNEHFIKSINRVNFMTGLNIPVGFTVTWDQVSLFVNYQKRITETTGLKEVIEEALGLREVTEGRIKLH